MEDDEAVREVVLIGKGRGGRTGRVELIATCRRLALEDGDTVDNMVWRVMRGLAHWGERGDAKCAALFLQYLAKMAPDSGTPADGVTVTNNTVVIEGGPPIPSNPSEYAAQGARVIRELDLLA
jgi:hypothetical protein